MPSERDKGGGGDNLNPFDFDDEEKPEKMLDCGVGFGLLSNIQDARDCACVIATVGKRKIVLPEELKPRLEPLLNQKIALARFDDEFCIVPFEEWVSR